MQMFGGPISGASMNPACSIGPPLVSGDLHTLWLYIVAPILGAAAGAPTYSSFAARRCGLLNCIPLTPEEEPRERPVRVRR